VHVSSAENRGFRTRSVQTKDYEIDICCFSAKHEVLRRKTGWVAISVSEWGDMYIRLLLFQ